MYLHYSHRDHNDIIEEMGKAIGKLDDHTVESVRGVLTGLLLEMEVYVSRLEANVDYQRTLIELDDEYRELRKKVSELDK